METSAHSLTFVQPSTSPYHPYTNGDSANHFPQLTVRQAAPILGLHPHYTYPSSRTRLDHDPYAYADYQRPRHPHRSTLCRHSSCSRSHSRGGSDVSLDEMLLKTMTGKSDVHAMHPSQHLHPTRHRSSSLSYPLNAHGRPHSGSNVLHPHPSINHVLQPNVLPDQGTIVQHVFTKPMTGSPVKKSMLTALNSNGSAMTMIGMFPPPCTAHPAHICAGPNDSIISGPSAIGGGGFPATNSSGQRICRQCGLPGHYKDSKCIEKWGPHLMRSHQ